MVSGLLCRKVGRTEGLMSVQLFFIMLIDGYIPVYKWVNRENTQQVSPMPCRFWIMMCQYQYIDVSHEDTDVNWELMMRDYCGWHKKRYYCTSYLTLNQIILIIKAVKKECLWSVSICVNNISKGSIFDSVSLITCLLYYFFIFHLNILGF